MKTIFAAFLMVFSLSAVASSFLESLLDRQSSDQSLGRFFVASSNFGQCAGACASEQGICISHCQGNGQCIANCNSAHGRCISRCN